MTFEQKRSAAIEIMAKTAIWRWNYAPPLWRLAWAFGMSVPPPHFIPFWRIALFFSAWMVSIMGLSMWLTTGNWRPHGMEIGTMAAILIIFGAAGGLAIAANYLRQRRKYRLPDWGDL